jgi:proteasome accessory factor B
VDVDAGRGLPIQPRLDAGEHAFEACYAAARDRRELTFDYRRPDEDAATRRHVQPWGVVAWHGRWYLGGLDLDRQRPRVFRLSRVVGTPAATGPAGAFEPPGDVDLTAMVAGQFGGEEQVVVVRARPGTAVGLRRHATPLDPAGDGDDRLELRTTEPWSLAGQLAAYGADVLVESPAVMRDAVVERLTRLAASA